MDINIISIINEIITAKVNDTNRWYWWGY